MKIKKMLEQRMPSMPSMPIFFFIMLIVPFFIQAQTQKQVKRKTKDTKISINHDKEIIFGQSAVLSGSFKLYGNIIKNAINMCFKRINNTGGIKGKKLRLISLNDMGNPLQAQKNIDLLKKQNITMFLGNMGTRSILKALPDIKSGKIAMFFPWSGNPQFKDEKLSHIINGPGLLTPQVQEIVNYITSNIKQKKIAVFHADDGFSSQAAKDLIKKLKENQITPTSVISYNRQTLNIAKQADKILETDPKIVICISVSMPTVRLINRFFEKGHYETKFFGVDSTLFVGNIMKHVGVKFYYASAVPNPLTSSIKLAKQYLDDLKKYYPKEIPNILSFAYYISASIITDAIEKIKGKITKEKIIQKIESMKNYNLKGFIVNFDKSNRHAFGKKVTIIKG